MEERLILLSLVVLKFCLGPKPCQVPLGNQFLYIPWCNYAIIFKNVEMTFLCKVLFYSNELDLYPVGILFFHK